MGMLILGVALWAAAHLFRRFSPQAYDRLGGKAKPAVAVAIAISLVLMVLGYRSSAFIAVWSPPAVMIHINNVLMLFAVYLMGVGHSKGRFAQKIRHPMLTGVKVWAFAHLLVNGDLASILLFGSMLAWAVVEVITINKAEPEWTPPAEIRKNGDLINAGVSAILYVIFAGVHVLLGVYPFG